MITILQGDWIDRLRTLPDASAQCCVTSPPYWGLRDYGVPGQLGLEKTPEEYVAKLVDGFREVRRVLRDDGTLWLNLGDSYVANVSGQVPQTKDHKGSGFAGPNRDGMTGLQPKNLIGIPWRVAFALQAHGWFLRSDIIWAKPNPMPESVIDRPTKAHEYIFLLTKQKRYYYDAEAIKEQSVSDHDSGNGFAGRQGGSDHLPMGGGVGTKEPWKRGRTGKNAFRGAGANRDSDSGPCNRGGRDMADVDANFNGTRNKRTVWTVATSPYKEAHFATFPPDLIKPCVMAGSKPGDTILDPFGGSGTTGQVALELGRNATLIELNPKYVAMMKDRTNVTPGLKLA